MTPSESLDGATSITADDLEQEIGTLIPRSTPNLAPTRLAPLPDYVKHREGVPSVGFLSSEAVARDFEAAAKEIEAMGSALVGAASKCEALTADVHRAIAFMHETATAYREEAKKIVARIEECALLTEHVRSTCEQLRNKVADSPGRDGVM